MAELLLQQQHIYFNSDNYTAWLRPDEVVVVNVFLPGFQCGSRWMETAEDTVTFTRPRMMLLENDNEARCYVQLGGREQSYQKHMF